MQNQDLLRQLINNDINIKKEATICTAWNNLLGHIGKSSHESVNRPLAPKLAYLSQNGGRGKVWSFFLGKRLIKARPAETVLEKRTDDHG